MMMKQFYRMFAKHSVEKLEIQCHVMQIFFRQINSKQSPLVKSYLHGIFATQWWQNNSVHNFHTLPKEEVTVLPKNS